ncbi:MAG TPA: hypothetical protein VH227_03820 [Candidatus Udaeobacter sp.]|jgi:hypothetical protein|nr:hypothetical protein [Candidatus Udaeobacter sp.]
MKQMKAMYPKHTILASNISVDLMFRAVPEALAATRNPAGAPKIYARFSHLT